MRSARMALLAVPALLALAGNQAFAAPPVQHFVSRPDLTPPVLNVTTKASPDVAPGSLFFTARNGAVQSGPVIMDNAGQLIWSGAKNYPGATDFRVQQYQGKPVLTFWQGTVDNGHGSGEDVVLDTSYRQIATVKAGNGQSSDLHEFQFTPSGTALVTAYKSVPADLTSVGGPKAGYVLDGVFQDIDIATGKVLFEWHSIDHVPFTDTYASVTGQGTAEHPLDYFHINSVERAQNGDYLISARHTHTVYRIDAKTGNPQWRLGGKHNDFSFGPGAQFDWQHNARFYGDENTLSLFDNADDDPNVPPNRAPSRGEILRLSGKNAALVREYRNPGSLVSVTQGDVAPQPNQDVVIGWGAQPEISEFSAAGKLLFDANFGQGLDSYRAYRFPWHATPTEHPTVVAKPDANGKMAVSVSWNGATEVARWRLLAGPDSAHLAEVSTVDRSGFETIINTTTASTVQLQALDANNTVIGESTPTPSS